MTVSIILAVIFIVLAVVFLMGKGDMLIAGYNTASEEERKKVNIHRLRLLMAIISAITAGFCVLMGFIGESSDKATVSAIIFILITTIILVLANTWAKKK
jgi:biotin transporter BioY